MNVLEFLRSSVIPLDRVAVATPATPYPSEAVMTVSYCASTGSAQKTESGATLETWGKLPDTMHLLAPRSKEDIEAELSDAGFFLGAGYLFRWYHSPGSRMEHRYRNMYSVIADVANATYEPLADDADVSADADRLMDLSEEYGTWEWEFNVAYRRNLAVPWQFESWKKHDPTIDGEGKRDRPFPGWDGSFEFQTTDEPNNVIQSEFYYAMPKRYRKYQHVLVKGLGVNER